MQVQKTEVKNRIMNAMLDEMEEHGYRHASMRRIAQAAGMTVGNLYRYYPAGKAEIAENVLGNVVNKIKNVILQYPAYIEGKDSIVALVQSISQEIVQILIDHRREFLIVIKQSQGTPYEGIKNQFIALIDARLREYIQINQEKQSRIVLEEPLYTKLFAISIVECVQTILEECEDIKRAKPLVETMIGMLLKSLTSS